MPVLVTGAAGFIGYHLSKALLARGEEVVGLDNMNAYYSVDLKRDRLKQLAGKPGFSFVEMDLCDRDGLKSLFAEHRFELVHNMAAQAGVRYSLQAPQDYVHSNLEGFVNLLECARHFELGHLVYASSSSVYGAVDARRLSRFIRTSITPTASMPPPKRPMSSWRIPMRTSSACR